MLIETPIENNARASIGVRKALFENVRWLILNVIFMKLHPEQGENLALSPTKTASISEAAIRYAESLWDVCVKLGFVSRRTVAGTDIFEQTRHFRSVFFPFSRL